MNFAEAEKIVRELRVISLSPAAQSEMLVSIALFIETIRPPSKGKHKSLGIAAGICSLIEDQILQPEIEATAFFALGKCRFPESATYLVNLLSMVHHRITLPDVTYNALIALENHLWVKSTRVKMQKEQRLAKLSELLNDTSAAWKQDIEMFSRVQSRLAQ